MRGVDQEACSQGGSPLEVIGDGESPLVAVGNRGTLGGPIVGGRNPLEPT